MHFAPTLHSGSSYFTTGSRFACVECTVPATCAPVMNFCALKLLQTAFSAHGNAFPVQKNCECGKMLCSKNFELLQFLLQQCAKSATYYVRNDTRTHGRGLSQWLCSVGHVVCAFFFVSQLWCCMSKSRLQMILLMLTIVSLCYLCCDRSRRCIWHNILHESTLGRP